MYNETDPGWWVLKALEKIGLVWNIQLPEDLLEREELKVMSSDYVYATFN